jgi:hypothetical protein
VGICDLMWEICDLKKVRGRAMMLHFRHGIGGGRFGSADTLSYEAPVSLCLASAAFNMIGMRFAYQP